MPTVDRVLPWRRNERPPADEVAPLLAAYRARHPKAPTALITRAYLASADAHRGQSRRSGEPYIQHPLAVARIVADLGLDDVTVAAALLHDAVEDTGVTLERPRGATSAATSAAIVDGVTKLDRIKFDTKEAQQAASMRKMLVAMAKDLRVLIIKLSDRLHNMRTIAAMPAWKQERTARETIDIYAPLAHRLGMQEVRQELEDLSFAALHPKRYAEIDHMVSTRSPERDLYLTQVLEQVRERLAELRINAEVTGRPKHLYSIYEKMVVKGREFDDIFDLVGIRVIVDSVKDCYAALGSIHATWKPVQGRFKDYVAMPKFNLYQSLHTTVVGPQGKPLEVQIRTYEMHTRAEQGVAAHWQYKDQTGVDAADVAWLNRIIDWQSETSDPDEFMNNLKIDLEQDEVFVFTPKGKVVTLAAGATPIDFAYAIHTEVGHACIGARVNGRLVPLDSKLSSGDSVEIFTSKVEGAGPSRDWLHIVATPRAASKIRQWFSRERREDAVDNGPRRAGQGAAPRGPAGPEARPGHRPPRGRQGAQLRRPRRALRRGRREPRVGQGHRGPGRPQGPRGRPEQRRGRGPPHHGAPASAAPAPGSARPPACTSRASTTSWCACRAAARRCPATRSSASSPAAAACRSTGPTAPTPSRWPPARATASSTSTGTSPTRAPSWPPSR